MNPRDRSLDNARRDDLRAGTTDAVEVVEVFPHVRPYPDDQDFNVCTVRLISRWTEKPREIERVRLLPLQRHYGHFQGETWNPRIGDVVMIYWLKDQEGIVLGSLPSYQQEPICRSQADREHQEVVFKLCPWEEPTEEESNFAIELIQKAGAWIENKIGLRNYLKFPLPKHPQCFKWWPKTRDSILIFDCLNGHRRPQCDRLAPCNSLDDLIARTYFKNFSDISETVTDEPWRFKFHHNSGSVAIWDNDGSVHIENKVSCETCGGSGCDGGCSSCDGSGLCPTCHGENSADCQDCGDLGVCPDCGGCGETPCSTCEGTGAVGKGHIHQYPEGTADLHAGNPHPNKDFIPLATEDHGVRVSVVHPDDNSVDFAFEAIQFATGAYIRIMKDGQIIISTPKKITIESTEDEVLVKAAAKITLDAPLVHVTEDHQIDGSCTHGPCSCE